MFERLNAKYIEISRQIITNEEEIDWKSFRECCEEYDPEHGELDFSSNQALWESVVIMMDELILN